MHKTFLVVILSASLTAWGVAQAGASTPGDSTAKPAAQPAQPGQPAQKPPEVLTDAVDPLNLVTERGRFFTATGPDSELSQEEFAASKGQAGSFARAYDSFQKMLAFDKNGNKTIDWFEAQAYRQDLRKRVLAAFDTDKDGKLAGQERDNANRALAAGKVPGGDAGTRRLGWLQPSPEDVKKYDADGDGKLNDEERKAMWADLRQRWLSERFDADGDGKLSEGETAAMEKAQAEAKAAYEGWRKAWVKKYDADGNGELSEEERKAAAEDLRKEVGKLAESWRAKWDTDGNGQLDPEETQAMRDSLRNRAEEIKKEIDADGDGKVTGQEMQAYWKKLREVYDLDKDGQLSPDELKQMIQDQMKKVRSEEAPKE